MHAKNRRATTEGDVRHEGHGGKGGSGLEADPECDDINFANYKGIYAEDDGADQKYTCPVTGAHFEFKDVCRRLLKVIELRKPFEEQLYGTNHEATTQSALTAEDFGQSMLSVSEELAA